MSKINKKIVEGLDDGERDATEAPNAQNADIGAAVDDTRDIPDAPDEVVTTDNDQPMDLTKDFIGRSVDTYFYLITSEEGREGRDLVIVNQDGLKMMSATEMGLGVTNEDIPEFLIKAFQGGEILQIEASAFAKYILPTVLQDDTEDEEVTDDVEADVESEDEAGDDTDEDQGSDEEDELSFESVSWNDDESTSQLFERIQSALVTDAELSRVTESEVVDMGDTDEEEYSPKSHEEEKFSDEAVDVYKHWLHTPKTKRTTLLSQNSKLGVSADFTEECPKKRAGTPCPGCYVEQSRMNMLKYIDRLMVDGELSAEDMKKNIDAGKFTTAPKKGFKRNTKIKDKDRYVNPIRKGDRFGMGPNTPKMIHKRFDYVAGGLSRKLAPDKIANLNKVGGLRLYSMSDYDVEDDKTLPLLFDDADKIGLKIKVITKDPEFVKKYSSRTSVTHISLDDFAAHGLTSNAISRKEALTLKRKYKNVKLRITALNIDDVIKKAKDPELDIITPFHGPIKGELEKLGGGVIIDHGNPSNHKKLLARIDKELTDQQRKKVCCLSRKCDTCDTKCGVGESKVMKSKKIKPIKENWETGELESWLINDISLYDQIVQAKEDNPLDSESAEALVADIFPGGPESMTEEEMGLVDWDAVAVTMNSISVRRVARLTEMRVMNREGDAVDVQLVDDGTLGTVISINNREFRFQSEFIHDGWYEEGSMIDGSLTEQGLTQLAIDAMSTLEPEEYHELLSASVDPSADVEADETDTEVDDAPLDKDAADELPVADDVDKDTKPVESKVVEAEDVGLEDSDDGLDDAVDLGAKVRGWRVEFGADYDTALDAIIHFYVDDTDMDNDFYRNNLYKSRILATYDACDELYVYASEDLYTRDPVSMTSDEIMDEYLRPFNAKVAELSGAEDAAANLDTPQGDEELDEKKSPPMCKKCNKVHWPFKGCGKQDDADEGVDKDVDKDTSDISVSERKAEAHLNMLLED